MITNKEPSRVIRAGAMLEVTDVPGKRTFALTVKDNAMHPLFSEGEIIIVNPDLKYKPGDYVVVGSQRGRSGEACYGNSRNSGVSTSFTH